MKTRNTFLIVRAAGFAFLLGTAGVASISVAGSAQDARETQLVAGGDSADDARAQPLMPTIASSAR